MKFQYTTTLAPNTKGKLAKRPLVELELMGKDRTINAFGLIDSGADTTLMNMEYARELGIDLTNAQKKEFLGIGNARVASFVAPVDMKVKHFDAVLTTPVAFTDSPAVDILLGQEEFFECFRIKFEKDHDTFELALSPKAKSN
jgi:hypothetical protein